MGYFLFGLIGGSLATIITMCLCIAAKHGDEYSIENNKITVTEKHLHGYCQRCYEPIITGDLYVTSRDKDYCLKCGCNRFKENNIRVATDIRA